MFDCERLTSVTIVCFLMAAAMFVVMLGVLCCAPRARIGNTTVLLVILALLSVASAGRKDEQPQPSPSTGGWTGDDDGAIDLAQPSTSRGGWSARGWSRRGQEDGEMKTCKYLDCTNLTSHGDAWDVRDCDKIQVSFLIDPFTNEREKVEGEEPPAKKSHWSK
ncbi:hypothetical protein J6590_085385 [Homalodisca vitripennis]|nr:hypothetical protein J6590_085385 [Homalodisca vitripennis]